MNLKDMMPTAIAVIVAMIAYDMFIKKALNISNYEEYDFEPYEDEDF